MPVSTQAPLPFILEDRTGLVASSDFDDIYDRLSLRVTERASSSPDTDGAPQRVLQLFDMPQRWSRRTERLHLGRAPVAILRFGANEALGSLELGLDSRPRAMPMAKYLPKTSMFGGSLSRQFVGTDGRTYRWSFRSSVQHEWVCWCPDDGRIVAHYDLRPPGQPTRDKSGNVLTIYDESAPLATELLVSLLIMRHIQLHHL